MAISYPLEMPAPAPAAVTLYTICNVSINRSPFTFTSQVQAQPGQAWGADITLPPMGRAAAEEWQSFLLKLNGPQGTFLLADPVAKTIRGVGSGTAKIDGSGQTGQSIAIKGLGASVTGVFLVGDYIEIEQRLYKVLNQVDSDSSGEATIDIWPRLRITSTDNTPIVMNPARGLFRLAATTNTLYQADADKLYRISFSAVEAI